MVPKWITVNNLNFSILKSWWPDQFFVHNPNVLNFRKFWCRVQQLFKIVIKRHRYKYQNHKFYCETNFDLTNLSLSFPSVKHNLDDGGSTYQPNFFPLHAVFFVVKIDQIIGWRPHLWGSTPRLGNPGSVTESLIFRHVKKLWYVTFILITFSICLFVFWEESLHMSLSQLS